MLAWLSLIGIGVMTFPLAPRTEAGERALATLDGRPSRDGALLSARLEKRYAEETGEGCWEQWSKEMEDYCEQDVQVTFKLYQKLQSLDLSPTAVTLEHAFCQVIARQERRGVAFDRPAAERLLVDLLDKREAAGRKLKEVFGWWLAKDKTFRFQNK